MESCKYQMFFSSNLSPNDKILCGAYSKTRLSNGKIWAHYPVCENKNCPLLHPELLEDAILDNELK